MNLVREQFSHCAEVWAHYPPQALRGRDAGRAVIVLQQQEDITETKQLLSVCALKTSDVTQEPKRGERKRPGIDNTHSTTMLS